MTKKMYDNKIQIQGQIENIQEKLNQQSIQENGIQQKREILQVSKSLDKLITEYMKSEK